MFNMFVAIAITICVLSIAVSAVALIRVAYVQGRIARALVDNSDTIVDLDKRIKQFGSRLDHSAATAIRHGDAIERLRVDVRALEKTSVPQTK